jgi:hypothetical protein
VKIKTAIGFFERLIGWWPKPKHEDADVLRFEDCRCVHTFGMQEALDVVFIDSAGQVLQTHAQVPPWRVVMHPHAAEVWELRAGKAEEWGLVVGRRVRSPQAGVSTLEVLLALVLVIWPLTSALLEYSQLAVSRQALHHAVAEAARAVERVDDLSAGGAYLRRVLAHHLLPAVATQPLAADNELELLQEAGAAQSLALRPDRLAIRVQPMRSVGDPPALGAQELRVEVRWCRELFFAPARQFIGVLAMWGADDIFDVACFATGGFPLRAEAYAWRPLSRPAFIAP